MDTIKVYGEKTKEYKRLEAAAILINAEFDNNFGEAVVKDTWWDYGGGIKWTTIVIGNCQALNPAQHQKLVQGEYSEFADVVRYVVASQRKYMNLVNGLRYEVWGEEK